MTTLTYLNNFEGICVRKIIVRGKSPDLALSYCSRVKDETSKFGQLLFEKKASEFSYFIIASFQDSVFMATWECLLNSQNIYFEDVITSKVLRLEDDTGNIKFLKINYKKIVNKLDLYKGAVLGYKQLSNTTYNLYLLFSDLDSMNEFTKEMHIKEVKGGTLCLNLQ